MHFEPPLGDTFRAYRKATDDLVQWIVSSARSTGTVAHIFESDAPGTRQSLLQKLKGKSTTAGSLMGRLKGRKRNHSKPASISPLFVELTYPMLRQLGKTIARTDEIDVDVNVLIVLKGIIQARKAFAT